MDIQTFTILGSIPLTYRSCGDWTSSCYTVQIPNEGEWALQLTLDSSHRFIANAWHSSGDQIYTRHPIDPNTCVADAFKIMLRG